MILSYFKRWWILTPDPEVQVAEECELVHMMIRYPLPSEEGTPFHVSKIFMLKMAQVKAS